MPTRTTAGNADDGSAGAGAGAGAAGTGHQHGTDHQQVYFVTCPVDFADSGSGAVFWESDGLHMSPAGYRQFGTNLAKILAGMGGRPSTLPATEAVVAPSLRIDN